MKIRGSRMKRFFRKIVPVILAALLVVPDFAFIAGGTVFADDGDGESSFTPPGNGLPVVYLDIDESRGKIAAMHSSSDHSVYCYGTVRIDAPDNFSYSDMDTSFGDIDSIGMSIRGRGNSTWTRYAKRPYKIKIDSRTDLLQRGNDEEHANKHWVLVANASDATLLKDRMTAWLADEMGFEFTPRGVPVDLVMVSNDPDNEEYFGGKYLGSYYLSENVRVDDTRLDIEELEEDDTELPTITGGYLVQNSSQVRVGSPDRFITDRGVGWATHTPSFDTEAEGHALTGEQLGDAGEAVSGEDIFNDPDPKENIDGVLTGDAYENDAQQKYIQEHMQMVEDALYADGTGYKDLMDTESAAKYWLINMFAGNHDAYGTGSTYIYKHRDKDDSVSKMYWGPVWDFDYAWYYDADDYSRPFYPGHEWLEPMFYDTGEGGFVEEVKAQWNAMKPLLREIAEEGGLLDRYSAETKASAVADRGVWKPEDDGFDQEYDERIREFKSWINSRIEWMDENIDSIDGMVHKVHFVSDGETWENYFVQNGKTVGRDPEVPEKEGCVFLGWIDADGNTYDSGVAVTEDKTFTAGFIAESEATRANDIAFRKASDVQIRGTYVNGYDIEYTVLPEDAQDKRVVWTSSDEDFATVDNEGHVRYVDKGTGTKTVTLTARLSSGVTKEFKLTLMDGDFPVPESISPEKGIIEMKPGGQAAFNITAQPENAKIHSYDYSSDDETVVTVDQRGVLKAVAQGETTVRVKTTAYPDQGDDIELDTSVTVKVSGEQPAPAPAPSPAPEPEIKVVVDTKLPKLTIRKPYRAKKAVTARWKKLSKKNKKKVQGIEIQIKGQGTDKIVKAGKGKASKKIKNLKKKKTYKVRVRTYKMVGNVKHVSKWSKFRKVKTR